MVRRTVVLAFLASSALAVNAQPDSARKASGPPTVGILAMGEGSVFHELPTYARFRAKMRDLGWRDGENIRYLGRGAGGDVAKLDLHMQEFVRARVTLVVTVGYREAFAAKRATGTIPIVMVHPGDPVDLGIVASFNRPGGNITGNFQDALALTGKRVELLGEIVPAAKRIVAGYDAPLPGPRYQAVANEAAKKRGITIMTAELPGSGDYDAWVAKAKREGAGAALIAHSASVYQQPARRKALAEALIKHRLPAICGTGEYVDSGCLASYSDSNIESFASAAVYVDKILRGAKPGDLPIQQSTIFELVINRKTAKALGITIPQTVLLRADRVIE